MGLNIGINSTQLSLINNNARANRVTDQASERLATSLRINRASDDPAGLIAAEELRGDLVDISAKFNVIDAQRRQITVQQTGRQIASESLREVRGLLVQASDGTISDGQRQAIQLQIDSSLDAIDQLGSVTGFALPASLEALREGGSANAINGDTTEGVALLEEELATINLASAAAGAYEKYTLDVDQRLAEDAAVAIASSLSQIADADYAQEASNLTKGQILSEASIRTLALSQQLQSDQVLSLLDTL